MRPLSAFSNSENLDYLFGGHKRVNVLICDRPPKIASGGFENALSSRDMYDILSVDEFNLPSYEYFAADYCRRLNRGLIKVFAKKDVCAAFTLEDEKYRLLGGIASRQKGAGGALLLAAIAGDKPVLCVAEDELIPFYTKFGFTLLYKAGYWRK